MSNFMERLERGDEDLIAVPRWVLRELADAGMELGLHHETWEAAKIAKAASEAPAGRFPQPKER